MDADYRLRELLVLALHAIAERVERDPGDLRTLGVDEILERFGRECLRAAYEVDTAEVPVYPPEGWQDDEITERVTQER